MSKEKTRNFIIIIILLLVLAGIVYAKRAKAPSQKPVDTTSYEQYLQQGINNEGKGDLVGAIEAYKKAAEIMPKEYVPYSDIGSVYYSMHKYPEAETAFLKAIDLQPNNVSVYTKLYDLYYHGLKRYPHQMNAFFTDAMKNTNNDIDIVKLYALYLEEINDPESALPIYQSLLKLEPNNIFYKAKVEALQKKINPNTY